MAKSTKIIAALGVAGALGVAALPMSAIHAADSDVLSVKDNVKVTVESSCTFKSTGGAVIAEDEYSPTGSLTTAGAAVEFGTHDFNVFCNQEKYTVTAKATGLTGGHGTDVIPFVADADFANAIKADAGSGTPGDNYTTGAWTVNVSGTNDGTDYVVTSTASEAGAVIVDMNKPTTAAGKTFTVKYKAYAGTDTHSGSYTGNVIYTINPNA